MKLTCPTCGPNASLSLHSERSGHRLVGCADCGLVFLEDRMDEINDEFYSDAESQVIEQRENKDKIEYWSYPEFFDKYDFVFRKFFADRWWALQKARPNPERLLDIGCGYGFFLDFVKEEIPHVKGLELDPQVAQYAREAKGLDVSGIKIENFEPDEPYDCITMCDVLEHLLDPVGILERCGACLNPSGVIYIQVPNLVGFKLPRGHGWGLPHHIWQFGPNSLRKLIEVAGFEVIGWSTGVLGIIGAYENGGPTVAQKITWATARTLKLGNRLVMVARKPA